MNDLQTFQHGEEGTHSVCNKHNIGGQSVCCECSGKTDCSEVFNAKSMEGYLSERYCDSRQWFFLTQVRSSTGSANRVADAMAFNMYGSTGYEILGFEIKVSRSDFLSELKDMSKSDEIMSYCDKWFLVVPDASIVKEGELPKNWGLLVLKDGKLAQKVRAITTRKEPMPDYFIASILRRSGDEVDRIRGQYIRREDIAGEIEAARKKGYEDARGYNGKQTEESLKRLREYVQEFEKASGIKLEEWRGKEDAKSVGMYVKVALSLDEDSLNYQVRSIESAIGTLQGGIAEITKVKKALRAETI